MKIYNYIEGYGKDYLACSDGFIYSDKKKTRVKLKGQLLNSGYLTVDLCWKGIIKKLSVHRLIAKNFIDNPQNKEQVNHINGNKLDNRPLNLEWNTRSENQLHSIKAGLRTTVGVKNSQTKLTEENVLRILKDLRPYKIISLEYKISVPTISDIKRGYSWTHITMLPNKKLKDSLIH